MKIFKPLTLVTAIAFFGAISGFSAIAAVSANDFIAKASEANLFEIQSSQLALQKSQNDSVKQFAQQMIDDHTAAGNKLKDTVSSSGTDQNQIATSLNSSHQKIMGKLNKLSGDDFDKKYVSVQKSAHKDAVSLFSSYGKNGDNAALKDFANQTLPVLKQHLDHVKKLSSSM